MPGKDSRKDAKSQRKPRILNYLLRLFPLPGEYRLCTVEVSEHLTFTKFDSLGATREAARQLRKAAHSINLAHASTF